MRLADTRRWHVPVRGVTPLLVVARGMLLMVVDNMVADVRGERDDTRSDLRTDQAAETRKKAERRSFLPSHEAGLAMLIQMAAP